MTRLENVKGCLQHDDRVEAISQACAYFVEMKGQDRDDAVKKHKTDAIESGLRRVMRHLVSDRRGLAGIGGGAEERTRWND